MNTPAWQALVVSVWEAAQGSAVLRAAWQGGLFVLVIWALCRFTPVRRRLPAGIVCLLWWLACLKFVVALAWTRPVALPVLPAAPIEQAAARPATAPNAPFAFPDAPGAGPAAAALPVVGSENSGSKGSAARLAEAAVIVWLVGIGACLGAGAVQWTTVRQLLAGAKPLDDKHVHALAAEVAGALGLRRVPRLLTLPDGAGVDPLAAGFLRPTIVFTQADLDCLDQQERRALLAHEFAHVRRADLWLGVVPLVARALFWWFPLAHLACREFALAREAACDALAVQAANMPPQRYGRLLLALGAAATDAPLLRWRLGQTVALGVSPHFQMLQRRMILLQNVELRSASAPVRRRRALRAALGLLLVAGAGLVPWRLAAAVTAPKPLPAAAAAAPASSGPQPVNLFFEQGLKGWSRGASGANVENLWYEIAHRPKRGRNGSAAAALFCATNDYQGHGVLRQDLGADAYRNKRVRLRGYLKTSGVAKRAGLMLTVGTEHGYRFWGEEQQGVSGTTDWKPYEYVVDVPANARYLWFGAALTGKGTLLADDFSLQVVGPHVPLTKAAPVLGTWDSEAPYSENDLPSAPRNLNFVHGLDGWGKSNPDGDAPDYVIGVDKMGGRNGGPAGYLAAAKAKPRGYGTLLQYFVPKQFRGKRVRYRAYLKTKNAQAAGLWIRLDTERIGYGGAGWNKEANPIRGTTGWTKYECVIDVPPQTVGINFGIDLTGRGTVWADDFSFEIVGKNVPVTPGAG